MTLEEKRKDRIAMILAMISKATREGLKVSKEKLIAHFMCEVGCSRRTTLEFLNALINSDKVIEEKGKDGVNELQARL